MIPLKRTLHKLFPIGRTNEAARYAWLAETIGRIPAGSRVLDAGAGEQHNRRYCGHLRYESQDFAQYTGDEHHPWNAAEVDIVSDITAIPVNDGSYDAVICTEVLEHVPHPLDALHELSRILKPGGQLVLTVPFASLPHQTPFFFHAGFSSYWLEKSLADTGFKAIHIKPNGNYFEYIAQELLRLPTVIRKYRAGRALFLTALLLIQPLLLVLQFSSLRNHGSESLLCYGYLVTAVKSS